MITNIWEFDGFSGQVVYSPTQKYKNSPPLLSPSSPPPLLGIMCEGFERNLIFPYPILR